MSDLSRLKEDFEPTKLASIKALKAALHGLPAGLRGDSADQRVAALHSYGALASGVAGVDNADAKEALGDELGSHWEDQIDLMTELVGHDDERTVHAVCSAVLATARALGKDNFEISFVVLLPFLLKQASASITAPASQCASQCIEGCVVACPSARALSPLSNAAANADPKMRDRASEYYVAIVNGWPDALLQRNIGKISVTLTCRTLLDSSKLAKRNGRLCVRGLLERFPEETRELLESLEEDTLKKLGAMLGEDIMAELNLSPPGSPNSPPPLSFADDPQAPDFSISDGPQPPPMSPPVAPPPMSPPQDDNDGDGDGGDADDDGVGLSMSVPEPPPASPQPPRPSSGMSRSFKLGRQDSDGRKSASPPPSPARPKPGRAGSYKLTRQGSGHVAPPASPSNRAVPASRSSKSAPNKATPRAVAHKDASPPAAAAAPNNAPPVQSRPKVTLVAPSNHRIRRASAPNVEAEKPRRLTMPAKGPVERKRNQAPRMSLRPPSEHEAEQVHVEVGQPAPTPAGLKDTMVVPETSLEYNMLSQEIDLNAQALLELWLLAADTSQRANFHLKADHDYLTARCDQLQSLVERMKDAFDVRDAWYRQRYLKPLENELLRVQERKAEVGRAVESMGGLHSKLMGHVGVSTRRAVDRERGMQHSAMSQAQDRHAEALASLQRELKASNAKIVVQKLNEEASSVECLPQLWRDAHDCKTKYMDPCLDEMMRQVGLRPEAVRKHALLPATKALERLFVEKGSDDFARLCDVVRATVTCADPDELLRCVRFVVGDKSIDVLSSENGTVEKQPALAHHDVVLYVRFSNDRTAHVCELRLQLAAVQQASCGTEHRKRHLASRLHILDDEMAQAEWSTEVLAQVGDGFARTVNLDYAQGVAFRALAAAVMSEGSRVESVSLTGCFPDADRVEKGVAEGQLEFVRAHRQTRLTDLNLNLNAALEDGHLALLNGCAALRSVELRECAAITDAGLIALLETTRALRYLDVSGCAKLTDAAVQAVAHHSPELRTVMLSSTRVTNASLEVLGGKCPLLQVLHAERTKVNDAGLEEFAQAKPRWLLEVNVGWTRVTDAGLHALSEGCADRLERLRLHNTRVTDRSLLDALVAFKGLRLLELSNTQVGDDGAKGIAAHCKRLRVLGLTNTKVSDHGVEAIAIECAELEEVRLNGTSVTDSAVVRLAEECPDLKEVGLFHTHVGDAGFAKLVELCPGLRLLDMLRTQVSEAKVEAVREARPGLTIYS